MEWLMIAVLLVMICVGLTVWTLVARRSPAEEKLERRIANLSDVGAPTSSSTGPSVDILRSTSAQLLAKRMTMLSKPLEIKTDYERNQLTLKLARGGIRQDGAMTLFLASKMLLLVLGATAGFTYAWSAKIPALDIFCYTTIAGLVGFMIPSLWLNMRTTSRAEKITNALPDSLDMLVIAVEAGLALDAAIQRVGDEMFRTYPEISEEWRIAARETQMGIPRSEAMSKMAERTGVSEMRTLVAVLSQAEKFGTSIAQTLRVHADTARVRRRQRAEERAAKTTVKLIFPLMFFLFPVIFIVILGPAVVNVMKSGLIK